MKVLVPLAVMSVPENSIAPFHLVRTSYIRKLVKYGLIPIFVSTEMARNMIDSLYEECRGVLFMGGSDIDPALYDEAAHEKTKAIEKDRDRLEQYILKKVFADRKPFLGICKGCQALAIASGGTLYQHIPDVFPEEHALGEEQSYNDLLTNHKHDVYLKPNSHIQALMQTEQLMVNTAHHQSIASLGPEFLVSGTSKAGVVEVIEHIDKNYFCFGIQAHPEAEEESFFETIFSSFAHEVSIKHEIVKARYN